MSFNSDLLKLIAKYLLLGTPVEQIIHDLQLASEEIEEPETDEE